MSNPGPDPRNVCARHTAEPLLAEPAQPTATALAAGALSPRSPSRGAAACPAAGARQASLPVPKKVSLIGATVSLIGAIRLRPLQGL